MNSAIREFYAAAKEYKDIDAVLDAMDYREHRNLKKDFINKLEEVHNQFIDKRDKGKAAA